MPPLRIISKAKYYMNLSQLLLEQQKEFEEKFCHYTILESGIDDGYIVGKDGTLWFLDSLLNDANSFLLQSNKKVLEAVIKEIEKRKSNEYVFAHEDIIHCKALSDLKSTLEESIKK